MNQRHLSNFKRPNLSGWKPALISKIRVFTEMRSLRLGPGGIGPLIYPSLLGVLPISLLAEVPPKPTRYAGEMPMH